MDKIRVANELIKIAKRILSIFQKHIGVIDLPLDEFLRESKLKKQEPIHNEIFNLLNFAKTHPKTKNKLIEMMREFVQDDKSATEIKEKAYNDARKKFIPENIQGPNGKEIKEKREKIVSKIENFISHNKGDNKETVMNKMNNFFKANPTYTEILKDIANKFYSYVGEYVQPATSYEGFSNKIQNYIYPRTKQEDFIPEEDKVEYFKQYPII